MANEQNLIPGGHKLTKEEQSKGGKASGEARRMRAAVRKVLDGEIPEDMCELRERLTALGAETKCYDGVALAMVLKAMKGDKSSADWVRDTAGEKPKDEVDLGGGVVILAGSDQIAD